jgi:hypothetical protein
VVGRAPELVDEYPDIDLGPDLPLVLSLLHPFAGQPAALGPELFRKMRFAEKI